jgi:hypothetical protein
MKKTRSKKSRDTVPLISAGIHSSSNSETASIGFLTNKAREEVPKIHPYLCDRNYLDRNVKYLSTYV